MIWSSNRFALLRGAIAWKGSWPIPNRGFPWRRWYWPGRIRCSAATCTTTSSAALGDGLARHNVVTLRFNYRGVGGSEGPAGDAVERLAWFWATSRAPDEEAHQTDLIGAIAYLRSIVGPELPLALVGYSFGCTLLSGAVPAAGAGAPLVLIAPTVGTHNYDPLAVIENPKLVIAPEGDFATDASRLTKWFERLPEPKELVRPRLDSHFFRGHESWLLATVGTFLNGEWR